MCQPCALDTISKSSRWPKPLEPLISDLTLLVSTTHTTLTTFKSTSSATPAKEDKKISAPSTTINITPAAQLSPLLPTLRDINTLLELLEEERVKWWQPKSSERKFWRETYQEDRLTGINVVNNKTLEMIEGLKARLGTFCRWTLGMKDGVEGLENGETEKKDVKMEE
jgi:hypothetical protein